MSEAAPPSPRPLDDRRLELALAALVALALAPAIGAGWLEYDDGWLVRDCPTFTLPPLEALRAIWLDLGPGTRLTLGAEYLPLRDTLVWLLFGVLGAPVAVLHGVQIAIYVAAVLLVRRWLLAAFGRTPAVELAAWLFALHPVHVEAVAWLASMKDVLMLLLSGAALLLSTSSRPRDRTIAVALAFLACFAKGSAVVLPGLFFVTDLAKRRPTDRPRLVASLVLSAAAAALHVHVGSVVGMIAEPIGGSRVTTAASMVVVLWRYLVLGTGLGPHSIVYEIDTLGWDSPLVLAGTVGLVVLVALAVTALRRGERWPLLAIAIFAIALVPVSQVLAPLQNRMADRYLAVAVLGPCLAIAHGIDFVTRRAGGRIPAIASVGLVAGATLLTFLRVLTFSSPIAVFAEATERTTTSAIPPYQLGIVLERDGRDGAAIDAYTLAIERDAYSSGRGRRAGNNLARLLARRGQLVEAETLLRELHGRYPNDPLSLRNLVIVLGDLGEEAEASRFRAELAERFPGDALEPSEP